MGAPSRTHHSRRPGQSRKLRLIGALLARRLVDANEIVALDNLQRDSLNGTGLADHPNFSFVQGDVLDADLLHGVGAGATHLASKEEVVSHC